MIETDGPEHQRDGLSGMPKRAPWPFFSNGLRRPDQTGGGDLANTLPNTDPDADPDTGRLSAVVIMIHAFQRRITMRTETQ